MKKVTKCLSLLLTFVVVMGLFTGCGSKDKKEDTTTNITDGKEDGNSSSKDSSDNGINASITVQVEKDWVFYYREAADRVLAKNPNAKIDFKEVGSFDHLDVLDSTDVTNEDVADVFAFPADRVFGLAQNEALANLDAKKMATDVGGFSDYDNGLGGNFNVDGNYLAFPLNIETLINFVNTSNAEAHGIDLSKTMEFSELGYRDMLVKVFDAWFGVAFTNSVGIELLGRDDSGKLYSDMTKDFSDLSKEQQDLFEVLFNYWKKHNDASTDLWDKEAIGGYMDSEFTSGGNNAIRLEGPWAIAGLSEISNDGKDLDIMPINRVTVNGKPLNHWKSGWGLGVNARIEDDKDKMALAQAMIEEIVNTDYAIDLFKNTGKILENVDISVYEESDLGEMDKKAISAVIESYKNAPARPLFTEWGSVWSTWENAVLSWSAVKPETAEEAYAEVKAAFEAMMTNF
ncbi:sugar ABC transporter substrate-binding protein [Vallitalea longa]|uniref:Sugar ABC transporter substrate-binding protein n=1 Tax=Vallitalea longa TaxID=2936439 RepID=A0A9W5YDF1_9FIRM|nr:hypothetical protein [Vallitalea longa]GKX30515.1 sugar ABC transporter substrate-binding protein [Vallitalea longa]